MELICPDLENRVRIEKNIMTDEYGRTQTLIKEHAPNDDY